MSPGDGVLPDEHGWMVPSCSLDRHGDIDACETNWTGEVLAPDHESGQGEYAEDKQSGQSRWVNRGQP